MAAFTITAEDREQLVRNTIAIIVSAGIEKEVLKSLLKRQTEKLELKNLLRECAA